MESPALEKQLKLVSQLVGDLFVVDAYYVQNSRLLLTLRYRFQREASLKLLKDRLNLAGYEFTLKPDEETVLLNLSRKRRLKIPRLNIVLFFATLLSVYFVPVFFMNLDAPTMTQAFWDTLADLGQGRGVEFTLAMISILLVHEMGHFIASRRRGIITSWPYFLPAPNIIGTFGAVIKSKSPFRNRRDLIEVGAAGPIAGWIVALLWLIYGLSESIVVPIAQIAEPGLYMTLQGESLLIRWLAPLFIGDLLPGFSYLFTEAAFAGWVGLLVTAINMLPIGQLDGGHVLYGLVPRRQALLGWAAMGVLLVLGFQSRLWWVFAAMGFIFKVPHPPTLNDRRKLSRTALIMAIVSLIILALSFAPAPFPV
ncbi:MAG: site-2 protease family protein [bacterium]|nr:site-2 protease family protein [bacterium]